LSAPAGLLLQTQTNKSAEIVSSYELVLGFKLTFQR
jgi:hypothetical protein